MRGLGLRFQVWEVALRDYKFYQMILQTANLPAPPNYPLSYPEYPLLRAITALLKGTWGVLVIRLYDLDRNPSFIDKGTVHVPKLYILWP